VWGGIEILVTAVVGLPEGTGCNGNPFLATVILQFCFKAYAHILQ